MPTCSLVHIGSCPGCHGKRMMETADAEKDRTFELLRQDF